MPPGSRDRDQAGPAEAQVLATAATQPASGRPGEEQGDCIGCRLTGLMVGLGGCGYVSSRLWVEPYPKGGHRVALVGVSAALLALGLSRAAGI